MSRFWIALLLCCGPLSAVTFTVTSLADTGAGTLRSAITSAEAAAGADDIVFAGTLSLPGTITLQAALPDITQDLTITGPASNDLVVRRNGTAAPFRIFTITGGVVAISNLWLGDGRTTSTAPASADGGCISNAGDLTLTDCLLFDCAASGGSASTGDGGLARGGAIFSSGPLTANGVAIVDCAATGGDTADGTAAGGVALGGGICCLGALDVRECLIEGCTAQAGANTGLPAQLSVPFGGGIQAQGATILRDTDIANCATLDASGTFDGGSGLHMPVGSLDMRRCSVRGGTGAAVWLDVAATLVNCTISGNQGLAFGGMRLFTASAKDLSYCTIHLNDGPTTGGISSAAATGMLGCIVAGNTGTNPDVQGAFSDQGFNLIGNATGSGSFTTSVLVGDSLNPINPGLIAIQNLGATWGHIPAFGSFAIDQGGGAAPIDDQRGGNRLFGAPPDIGALEFLPNQAPSFTAGPAVVEENDGQTITIAGWATNISPGVSWEAGQQLTFTVTGSSFAFRDQPEIDPVTGDLSFRPARDYAGVFYFDVILRDNGGTAGGGLDTSSAALLIIELEDEDFDDDDNDDFHCSSGTARGHGLLALLGVMALLGCRLRRTS